ncbi:hypothetical protein BJ165DRAFT_1347605, partial [Panaeolus papilionaceus]
DVQNVPESDAEWYPYPSKLVFLLDTLDNLPRLCVSSGFMRTLLWMLWELGIKHVPSYDAFKTIQQSVRESVGVGTTQLQSPKGNIFSFNNPCKLIAKDWANPSVCNYIHRYPVIPSNGVISEIWHAEKWRCDLDRHILSPMYDDGNGRHYFIDEPACLEDGQMVIPVRWLENEHGQVLCELWEVKKDTGTSTILDEKTILIEARQLFRNMKDLKCEGLIPLWCRRTIESGHPNRMPNPNCALADGDPIYVSFINIFGDDISGNRSKSWNKHWNMYMTHRNLPRLLLNHQFHIHFVSTSTVATIPEQFTGVKAAILKSQHTPIRVRHGKTGQQIRFKVYCTCGPGDNPSQSETSGHIGGNGNHPCRKCHVGGTQKEKQTDVGYHALFEAGRNRSGQETLKQVKEQVHTACLGVAATVKKLQAATGVKDAYTQYWIEDLISCTRELKKSCPEWNSNDIQNHLREWVDTNKSIIYNPFLTLDGFDAAQDTPVEILHTILLGVVKYVWRGSYTTWNATQKAVYSNHLQATNIMAIRAKYITQYANSLIGQQLKVLTQINTFHVHDLVSEHQFLLTKAVGELSALLWYPEIRDMDQYLADVATAAENVLDIAALVDPFKIVVKIKYHLLAHLTQDIKQFGPLVGVASEVYKAFNGIFRYCSIFSNHLAPSRDIAIQLSAQESVKHILNAGWWIKPGLGNTSDWVCPGPSLQRFVLKNAALRSLVGQPNVSVVQLAPIKRAKNRTKIAREKVLWHATLSSSSVNHGNQYLHFVWYQGKSVISRAGDNCGIGEWVFALSPYQTNEVSPSLLLISRRKFYKHSLVALDIYQVAADRHDTFGVPILLWRQNEHQVTIVAAKDILFNFNAQHDCRKAQCTNTGRRNVVHERVQIDQTEACIQHNPLNEYLINTHSLHNAHLLRDSLPRDLITPLPFREHQREYHDQIANQLREMQLNKQEAAAQRKAEKAAESNSRKRQQTSDEAGMNTEDQMVIDHDTEWIPYLSVDT